MDCDIKFVIFVSHNIYIFKLKITWGLNYHMTAAIWAAAWTLSMLSSQDEAGKLEFRSEKISYYSVYSNSFFF